MKRHNGKFLALILRHKPEAGNLTLDKEGWASVKEVLSALNLSKKDLDELVDLDDKGRYEYSKDQKKIRARQGHSVNVEIEFKEFTPTSNLYHGTVWPSVEGIMKTGLKSMSRLYVHLSKDVQTATKVGSRRGQPVILEIDAVKANREGVKFWISNNGVVLAKHVPIAYINVKEK